MKKIDELFIKLKSEWSKDNKYPLENYVRGSGFRAKWNHTCECGEIHTWHSQVRNRYNGRGCPRCIGSSGFVICYCKSLKALRPDLCEEWHFKFNLKGPECFSLGSNIKVWWKCRECNEDWDAVISSRVSGSGCPFCTNQRITLKKSLAIMYPEIAKEWNYKRNDTKPQQHFPGSSRKVWWKCENCNNEWEAVIFSRVSGRGCPKCRKSRGEKIIENELKKIGIKYVSQKHFSWMEINRMYFDFYIPEKKLVIEFDGAQHFRPIGQFGGEEEFQRQIIRDIYRSQYCQKNGLSILRIYHLDIKDIPILLEIALRDFSHNFFMTSRNYPTNFVFIDGKYLE